MSHDISGGASLLIAKPIGDVWSFVSDSANFGKWISNFSAGRWNDDGDPHTGSTLTAGYTFMGKTEDHVYRVEAWEPSKLLEFRTDRKNAPVTYRISLEEAQGGTNVSFSKIMNMPSGCMSALFGGQGGSTTQENTAEAEKDLVALSEAQHSAA